MSKSKSKRSTLTGNYPTLESIARLEQATRIRLDELHNYTRQSNTDLCATMQTVRKSTQQLEEMQNTVNNLIGEVRHLRKVIRTDFLESKADTLYGYVTSRLTWKIWNFLRFGAPRKALIEEIQLWVQERSQDRSIVWMPVDSSGGPIEQIQEKEDESNDRE